MGNHQCCCSAKDDADAVLASMDAVSITDDALSVGLRITGGNTEQERIFTAKLTKSEGENLGLSVECVTWRRILPVLSIKGGAAGRWNETQSAKIRPGDSILKVNSVQGRAEKMLEECRADIVELTFCRCLTQEFLVEDLSRLVETRNCGPILIRLSWHDAGVFNGRDGRPDARMRLPSGEHDFPANSGLQNGIALLQPIAEKYVPRLLSHADLWALAANVAIKVMGGPTIQTHFGRRDAKSSEEGVSSEEGRLVDGDKDAKHLREIYYPKGLDDKDIVALSGLRHVGMYTGPQTSTKDTKFTNAYFKDLFIKPWKLELTQAGQRQYKCGATLMLPVDLAMVDDAGFKKHVARYAKDQDVWFQEFAEAWQKLQELGCGELWDEL